MWWPHESLRERLATALPALALGLAAGVTGGVLAAGALDTTPYGQIEFNTAARNARLAGEAHGRTEAQQDATAATARLKAANRTELERLEGRLADTREALRAKERQLQRAKKEAGEREARLQGSLAEKAAALDNATSQARAQAGGQSVTGTVQATSVFRGRPGTWPTDCREPLQAYQVRVTAGPDATVAVGGVVDAEVAKRSERKKVLTLSCSLTYEVTLPTPLGAEYRFVAESESHGSTQVAKTAPAAALADGAGPTLRVSF